MLSSSFSPVDVQQLQYHLSHLSHTNPAVEVRGVSLLLAGCGSSGSPHGLHLHPGKWVRAHYWPVRMKISALYLAFPDNMLAGVIRDLITATWLLKSRLSTWHFLAWVGWSQYFLWYLAGVQQLLSKSVLSCYFASFLVFWLEKAGFCGGFFCLRLLAFPGYQLLQLQNWDI